MRVLLLPSLLLVLRLLSVAVEALVRVVAEVRLLLLLAVVVLVRVVLELRVLLGVVTLLLLLLLLLRELLVVAGVAVLPVERVPLLLELLCDDEGRVVVLLLRDVDPLSREVLLVEVEVVVRVLLVVLPLWVGRVVAVCEPWLRTLVGACEVVVAVRPPWLLPSSA